VVVGIIGIMAAVALPQIARYIRNFRIMGASRQVLDEVARARGRAITNNTNNGVIFIAGVNNTDDQYQFWVEDDPAAAPTDPSRPAVPIAPATGPPNGVVHRLPQDIHFTVAAGGAGWVGRAMRFNRLGQGCLAGSSLTTCPNPNGAAPAGQYISSPGPPWTIRLRQDRSPLTATLTIQAGGMIRLSQP
jgi:Tfp pilus assembly major pilin PilA